ALRSTFKGQDRSVISTPEAINSIGTTAISASKRASRCWSRSSRGRRGRFRVLGGITSKQLRRCRGCARLCSTLNGSSRGHVHPAAAGHVGSKSIFKLAWKVDSPRSSVRSLFGRVIAHSTATKKKTTKCLPRDFRRRLRRDTTRTSSLPQIGLACASRNRRKMATKSTLPKKHKQPPYQYVIRWPGREDSNLRKAEAKSNSPAQKCHPLI